MTATTTLPAPVIEGAMNHLNNEHQKSLLNYAKNLAGCEWAESASIANIDAVGFELAVVGNGRNETHRVNFQAPVTDAASLRTSFINLAQIADQPDGIIRTVKATVKTENAGRIIKTLCNHFARKVDASYEGNNGRINFPFGDCQLTAQEDALLINIEAESDTLLDRAKYVVGDHLIRFAPKEEIVLEWVEQ